jgi:acyl-CoA reductase-like NAD-dependent aldehyde dehydrogenase
MANDADNISVAVYLANELVTSDPRSPSGCAKKPCYGRELSKECMMEFVNLETVL